MHNAIAHCAIHPRISAPPVVSATCSALSSVQAASRIRSASCRIAFHGSTNDYRIAFESGRPAAATFEIRGRGGIFDFSVSILDASCPTRRLTLRFVVCSLYTESRKAALKKLQGTKELREILKLKIEFYKLYSLNFRISLLPL